ncbi:glutathione-regulated potassium-efflux system oxidoreductase KefF [Aeromonas schubertii]|uniref:glutathione-regulated potassium-efflux system oxidoreductase KefF n=1 Tax=Aeromonas schubertii TaxID=652 RepID=UPI00067E667B|nr:NAD(P)H-dependent oxidoreductase [Aeromonas schubertii]KUE78268.1 NAD(P)H oxidoreductase [Aeromonas schubertii]QCG46530.1 NAD(P)H oxidoreductase [Aeromonas schubertii]
MKRILVLFAHPALQKSRANRSLLQAISDLEGVTLHDLYQTYPDQLIDVKREQALLAEHDLIVFQHPFYWYSCPAILKEWCDLVLEYGYAYGQEGTALHGKQWLSAITTGGAPESYSEAGYNHRPLLDFLLPFQQTARMCGMTWLPPFVLHSFHKLSEPGAFTRCGQEYRRLLEALRDDRLAQEQLAGRDYLRDLLEAL